MTNELKKVSIIPEPPGLSVIPPAALTPMDMLSKALDSGAPIELLEKLMGLQERWENNQARKAFDNALAAAKAEIPKIIKNREVDFTSPKGRTHYRYEDLGGIAELIDPILAKHGLFYRYRTTSVLNEPVSVTCIVSHRDGHFEENTLFAGRDDTGGKNQIQQVSSTITYLQRITLKAALGLAASNDDDGRASGTTQKPCITQEQADILIDVLESHGKDRAKFLKWAKVDYVEQILADQYQSCLDAANYKAPAK